MVIPNYNFGIPRFNGVTRSYNFDIPRLHEVINLVYQGYTML